MDTRLGFTSRFLTRLLKREVGALALCAMAISMTSCGHTQAAAPSIPISSVMDAVREYGRGNKSSPSSTEKTKSVPPAPPSDEPNNLAEPYQAHISAMFAAGDFAQLEKEAREVRISKSRVRGGPWKLAILYDGVASPFEGDRASDSDWEAHLAAVKKWIAAYPDSATARLALAATYTSYAWAARGSGYANTVSDSGWELFGQRMELAKAALLDAARLKEKCPYWYEAMQKVALAEGWEKQDARDLLDQAMAFDPSYYHFYREYANYLLPKWYGEEGETLALAEEMSNRLGEPYGSVVYFEIASQLACQCDPNRNSLEGVSWAKVKQGYADLQSLYGTSKVKMNRFAFMSFLEGDKSSARDTFALLGDNWNPDVWRTQDKFYSAKEWAQTP